MKNKCYKIKRTDTQEYWSGYGSTFTQRGFTWSTAADAAYSLQTQLGYKHESIKDWLPIAVIVEYEIQTIELGESIAHHHIAYNLHSAALKKSYGHDFMKHYGKMQQDPNTQDKFNFAIEVQPDSFKQFRDNLKCLGFSSRTYKKTDSWLWIVDDAIVMNAKLIDGASTIVNLKEVRDQYQTMLEQSDAKLNLNTNT